jgi:hypothetical protein
MESDFSRREIGSNVGVPEVSLMPGRRAGIVLILDVR